MPSSKILKAMPCHLLIVCTAVAMLAPSYFILSPDLESMGTTIMSVIFQAGAIRDGTYTFWTSSLGFGMPQPFSQYVYFHPVLLLLAWLPAKVAIIAFYQFHILLGAFSMWFLCRAVDIRKWIALVCVLTYLLCSATLNYALTDFWPGVFELWTFLPLVILIIIKLASAKGPLDSALFALCLGLVATLMTLNSHFGVFVTYTVPVFIFIACQGRAVLAKWSWFALAAVIALALSASKIYYHYTEYILFEPGKFRTFIEYSLFTLKDMWGLLISPIHPVNLETLKISACSRVVWMGSVFLILAFWAVFSGKVLSPYRRSFAVVFISCFFFLHLPRELAFRVVAWPIAFRDPLTVAGIVLAGMMLSSLGQADVSKTRKFIVALCVVQLGLLAVGALPFWLRNVSTALEIHGHGDLSFFPTSQKSLRPLLSESELVKGLKKSVSGHKGRLYYSERVNSLINNVPDKLGFVGNTLPYHGISVVNGNFKGISYDAFYPDTKLMHGTIRSQNSVIRNKALLDVLAVRYILAGAGEEVAPDLRPLMVSTMEWGESLVLYVNNDAWPEAFVTDPAVRGMVLPRLEHCGHDRLLCADFSGIAAWGRKDEAVEMTRGHGGMVLSLPPSDRARSLMISECYRPGWKACGSAGGKERPVDLYPVLEGFIGMTVPPGMTRVTLHYAPKARMVLEGVSWTGLFTVTAGIIVLLWMRRRRANVLES